ncbi:hypothetical protein KM043_002142 [Ampulex compressa]|nr:hypothetical protein KM043_002142 [Ampulex compressa]
MLLSIVESKESRKCSSCHIFRNLSADIYIGLIYKYAGQRPGEIRSLNSVQANEPNSQKWQNSWSSSASPSWPSPWLCPATCLDFLAPRREIAAHRSSATRGLSDAPRLHVESGEASSRPSSHP